MLISPDLLTLMKYYYFFLNKLLANLNDNEYHYH